MLQNRFTHDNSPTDDATLVTVANGKTPHANGKHRKPAKSATPSTNGSNGGAGRSGDLTHGDVPPSTNGSNGAAAPTEGHQDDGRFAKGNKGGPGNPFARQTARLRQVMLDATTPDRMRAVADKLYELAMEGDMAAAKLLLSYTIGKPKPAPEPDLLDEDEWDRYKAQAPMFSEMPALLTKCAPGLPLELVRTAKPAVTREQGSMLGTVLSVPAKKQGPLLDRLKYMTKAQVAAELRKVAATLPSAAGKPSTNGSPPGKASD